MSTLVKRIRSMLNAPAKQRETSSNNDDNVEDGRGERKCNTLPRNRGGAASTSSIRRRASASRLWQRLVSRTDEMPQNGSLFYADISNGSTVLSQQQQQEATIAATIYLLCQY